MKAMFLDEFERDLKASRLKYLKWFLKMEAEF